MHSIQATSSQAVPMVDIINGSQSSILLSPHVVSDPLFNSMLMKQLIKIITYWINLFGFQIQMRKLRPRESEVQ